MRAYRRWTNWLPLIFYRAVIPWTNVKKHTHGIPTYHNGKCLDARLDKHLGCAHFRLFAVTIYRTNSYKKTPLVNADVRVFFTNFLMRFFLPSLRACTLGENCFMVIF
jgi:hypothetical protein